ncbi:MAG: arginine--tRNA ligase [Gemmataceae bacterium]|nr:arginine--tRNA ligase [Gemmataceae bacterium]MDW8264221.1 arginine--tRNA ligase [Gemmataceae bacterium]
MNLLSLLQEKLTAALTGLVPHPETYGALVRPTQDERHGDYQANAAMPLAKVLGQKPLDVARRIVERLALDDVVEPPAIAGPGFINFRFRSDWLARQLQAAAADDRLGVSSTARPRTVVIDFSSPNVAKPMHVGHLRSTIIGDSLTRLLRFLGHRVITDNHLGDWGTQFGMLLYGYKHYRNEEALRTDPVREMARLYVKVRQEIAAGEDEAEEAANPVAEACRQETAKLHAGDEENVRLWRLFMPWCLADIERIYRRLDVRFDHTLGESFYHPMLADVVQSLLDRGIAQKSEGAVVVWFGANEPPALIRKKDGAFTYMTTDLATIRYRVETWKPDAILYVVDFRQSLHFKNLFDTARRWGYDQVELVHVSFGSVLGPDRRPIKTREGGAIELEQLLDEAVARAEQQYERTREERLARGEEVPELGADERRQVAETVGLGAVKYADLSQNRESDYVFNWDKMLAMDGNTATYMQYAYVRNRGIFRKSGAAVEPFRTEPPEPTLTHPAERALALQLLRFSETLQAAAIEYRPHLICGYLWELAKSYSVFFQNCPVLRAETSVLTRSRLLLCDLTARTIQRGLDLLGIRTVERM